VGIVPTSARKGERLRWGCRKSGRDLSNCPAAADEGILGRGRGFVPMAIVSAFGAGITLILGKIVRDIPDGRGLEEVSQPMVASQGRHARC
jgi:hypothetical protein